MGRANDAVARLGRWPAWQFGRQAAERLIDGLFPHRCASCGTETVAAGVCGECFAGLTPITGSICARCGLPFELAQPDGSVCAACLARPPRYPCARAAFVYAAVSRDLILAFKRGDRTDLAPVLATHLARVAAPLLGPDTVIVPVPLHRSRLRRRRYNQAVLLGRILAARCRRDFAAGALIRKRATPSQGGLNPSQRRRNVAGAFAVRQPRRVAGRPVVLVDDVLTTGATANACARALMRGGILEMP
ncbi:MAG: ComF family protein [Rhodothalassiaceae bacterium]